MFLRSASLLAALSLCVSTPVWAQAAAQKAAPLKPVTVNGKPIPKSRLDFIAKQRANQGQPDNEQARKAILDNLITQEVVAQEADRDRKSTRLNSSHRCISYAVFCLKKKKKKKKKQK